MRYVGSRTVGSELAFTSMGSKAHVIVVGGHEALADAARRRLFDLEQRWSRFVPASEVSRLTAQAGERVPVSAETRLLVSRAVEAWRLTGGAFDPTVLGDVVRAGYDRTFSQIDGRAGHSDLAVGCTDIEVTGDAVRLPAGTGFDAGGIGKGLAADLVVDEVMAAGAEGVCVNLGGDLRVHGVSPDGPWTIAIEHEWFDEPIALVGLAEGAVATSTTLRRRWTVDAHERHHLIDPRTGEPAVTDLTLASVISGEAWVAEVLAKAVLLRGSRHAFDLLGCDDAALAVDGDGRAQTSDGFLAFTGTAA
jgi:thiamine biosynthesis lipoprotein